MQNPKTSIAGYIGVGATLLGVLGTAWLATRPQSPWAQALVVVATALKGVDSVGNIASQDGGH